MKQKYLSKAVMVAQEPSVFVERNLLNMVGQMVETVEREEMSSLKPCQILIPLLIFVTSNTSRPKRVTMEWVKNVVVLLGTTYSFESLLAHKFLLKIRKPF